MVTSLSYSPDNLIADPNVPLKTIAITLLSGQNLVRGTLLGKKKSKVGTVTAGGGNTGNGTVTGFAVGPEAKNGNYTIKCIEADTDGGTFKVIDPDGNRLDDAIVGTAYDTDIIDFTINDGSTDFAADDEFTLPVEAETVKYLESLAAALDGSEEPDAILAEDCDASAADKTTVAYVNGCFNSNKVTFGTGHTAASVGDELRKKGILLEAAVASNV